MRTIVCLLTPLILLGGCAGEDDASSDTADTTAGGNGDTAAAATPGADFWDAIAPYCDQAFEGEATSLRPGDEGFAEDGVRVHIRRCQDSRLMMPLKVGDDRSRTWVLERHPWGVTLKHQHRHEDGSADAVSNYGGLARPPADGTTLDFPVDDETRAMLPRAGGHTWSLAIEDETLVYELRQADVESSFRLEFDLSEPVEPPAAPWGWNEITTD